MKKFIIAGCLFLVGGVWAAPWGAIADYDLPAAPIGESSFSDTPAQELGERYLLKKVLAAEPVKVSLSEENGSMQTLEALQDKVQEAYNSWFLHAAKEIRHANRIQEFADILPVLEKGIPVEFVAEGEDIEIKFVDREEIPHLCGKQARACYVKGERVPTIYVPKNPKRSRANPFQGTPSKILFVDLTHEIGHSLGLSDQYVGERESNTHAVYHGQNPDKTIMNNASSLSCDDADGMINLIDITRKKHRGGQQGWRSLCKKSKVYYVGGAQFGIGPYGIYINADETAWQLRTYKEGVYTGSTEFEIDYNQSLSPFMPFTEQVTRRDLLGRPLEAQGPKGERVYYMHLYDSSVRLVTAGRKALLLEETSLMVEKGKKLTEKNSYFGKNGRFAKVRALKSKTQGQAFYVEGEGEKAIFVTIWFNKKGASDGLWHEPATDRAFPARSFSAAHQRNVEDRLNKQIENEYKEQEKARLEEQIRTWYYQVPLK